MGDFINFESEKFNIVHTVPIFTYKCLKLLIPELF